MIKDYKGRSIQEGERVRIEEDIPSVNGMLYKNSIVKINDFDIKNNKIRVTDNLGKIWFIEPSQVSCSFL
tara:strand:+ start:1066 stop:1275 length:210 start_codon:yes stop_codon:yes gene_type:complete